MDRLKHTTSKTFPEGLKCLLAPLWFATFTNTVQVFRSREISGVKILISILALVLIISIYRRSFRGFIALRLLVGVFGAEVSAFSLMPIFGVISYPMPIFVVFSDPLKVNYFVVSLISAVLFVFFVWATIAIYNYLLRPEVVECFN